MAVALRRHAAGLPIAGDVGAELDAIAERRSLLDEMDPVSPCVAKLAKALGEALGKARDGLAKAVADATARLDADRAWSELDDADRAAILSDMGLLAPAPPAVDTDQACDGSWRSTTCLLGMRRPTPRRPAGRGTGSGGRPPPRRRRLRRRSSPASDPRGRARRAPVARRTREEAYGRGQERTVVVK